MNPALRELWRRIRLELLMLAEGRTARLDKGAPPAEPDHSPPHAGEDLREFDARWAGCRTDDQRRKVLNAAIEFLSLHQPKADFGKYRGTKEWEVAIAFDPRSARTVARMYDVSPQTVCNYRERYKEVV